MVNEWPKKIYGDPNLISKFCELYDSNSKLAFEKCKEPADHIFVGWLSQWYPELFGEYNKVVSGELDFDDLPKYELIE